MDSISTSALVNLISQKGYTKKASAEFIADLVSIMKEELLKGKSIKLAQFCILKPRTRKEHMGVDPQTCEPRVIGAKRTILFVPSDSFKAELNPKKEIHKENEVD